MITNIQDLAAHLGAYEDTDKSIARRVYKDTSCGCPAGVKEGSVGKNRVHYTVTLRLRRDNRLALEEWATPEQRREGFSNHHDDRQYALPLPAGLKEYLFLDDGDWTLGSDVTVADVIGGEQSAEVRAGYGSDTNYKSRYLQIRLDLEIDEPVTGTYFYVMGYCEGSDAEHEVYEVPFPCTPEAIDEAIAQADKDGAATWDATHGCDDCGTEPEWELYPVSPTTTCERPINPDCPSCKGEGIVL